MLQEKFQQHLTSHLPFLTKNKFLIACSGGLDSMVLLHLCHASQLAIGVAHCNFKLRKSESDEDADFIKNSASHLEVPLFIRDFETNAFAKANKLSTQLAARQLRYQWFEVLCEEEDYRYIVTAHHANDAAETFLINTLRGSGINGLAGIPEKRGAVIRPLLPFTRKELERYAEEHQLQWREDSSNKTDAYLRNQIRHHIVPALEVIDPQWVRQFETTQKHLRSTQNLLKTYKEDLIQAFGDKEAAAREQSLLAIDLTALHKHPYPEDVLYLLLEEFGFTAWKDIYDLQTAQSGKVIYGDGYRLLKNRGFLLLHSIEPIQSDSTYIVFADTKVVKGDFGSLLFEGATTAEFGDSNKTYVNRDALIYPLTIRRWKSGDFFYPLGMNGKKKLSKFFKDEKVSLISKETAWVLVNGDDQIIWLIGKRLDNRFKIKETSPHVLKVTQTL